MAFANQLEKLRHLLSGFRILDEERCQDFTINLLFNLSIGVEEGKWSEEKYPESFAELRNTLTTDKAWYLMQPQFMRELHNFREDFPRTHWWWWIEELP